MRPVKLIMQAFGSYGKLTQIDFQEPNQNLFLVTGDTGAGKTTIFDALVFALYGEASSSQVEIKGGALEEGAKTLCTAAAWVANEPELSFEREIPEDMKRELEKYFA